MRERGEQAPVGRRADGRRRAGTHRRGGRGAGLLITRRRRGTGTGPLITRRDHVPERPRRGLPAPSPSALVGLAVLVLIAFGAIHLSGSGTAVPLEDPPNASVIEPGQGPGVGSSGADDDSGTSDGAGTSEGAGAADGDASGDAAVEGTAGGSTAPDGGASGGESPPAELVVHVSGAVAGPGVVRLPAGARVDDALRAAGGASKDADLAAVNLARPVADGEQIHVPVPGEEPPAAVACSPPGAPADPDTSGAGSGTGSQPSEGLINLNTADAAALEELPGVGPAIAARIVEHREKNGPFTSVDDLLEVSGIGPAKLEGLREQATV